MKAFQYQLREFVVKVENGKFFRYHCYEFEAALSELKSGKAEGKDGIPTELLKARGVKGKRELYDICNEIYVTGEWPDDFLDSVIIQ